MSHGAPFWMHSSLQERQKGRCACAPQSDVETRACHDAGFGVDGQLRSASRFDAVEAIAMEPTPRFDFPRVMPCSSTPGMPCTRHRRSDAMSLLPVIDPSSTIQASFQFF